MYWAWWEWAVVRGWPENQVKVSHITSGLKCPVREPNVFPTPHRLSSPSLALPQLPPFRNVSFNCCHDIKHSAKSQAWECHAHEIVSFELSLIPCLWVFWLDYLFTFFFFFLIRPHLRTREASCIITRYSVLSALGDSILDKVWGVWG